MKLLYFLSKTDTGIIRHCPPSTQMIRASLGFFVLLTGILAFCSGTYAISNLFVHENAITLKPEMMTGGWIFSIILGGIYSAFIMAIDREIVASHTIVTALIRIPMAIFIGLVISVPVELQIFSSKITRELAQQTLKTRNELRTSIEQRSLIPMENKLDTLQRLRNAAIRDKNMWDAATADEITGAVKTDRSGKAGLGQAYRIDSVNAQKQTSLIEMYDREINLLENKIAGEKTSAEQKYEQENIAGSYDLLSRYIALNDVKMNDRTGSASEMGLFITVLFLLFEVTPALMKVFLPKTEYDVLLDKRRLLNINATKLIYQQSYLTYTGMTVDEIKNSNPQAVEKMYRTQSTHTVLGEIIAQT